MRRATLRRMLASIAATVLATVSLVVLGARPALAADSCAGTIGFQAAPGVSLDEVRDIHITLLEGASLVCAAPLLGTLVVKEVNIYVSGTCLATGLNSSPPSTVEVRFSGESSDSTIEIDDFVLGGTSVSKVIGFMGEVQDGDPQEGKTVELVNASLGDTTDCDTDDGLEEFTVAATVTVT